MPIQWKKEFELGIKIIDNQHKHFLEALNALYVALDAADAKTLVNETLNFLTLYVNIHFKTEEDYFKEFGYPDAPAHIVAHKSFKVKLDELSKRANAEGSDILLELVAAMEDWLVQHILIVDRKYAGFFKEHGL